MSTPSQVDVEDGGCCGCLMLFAAVLLFLIVAKALWWLFTVAWNFIPCC